MNSFIDPFLSGALLTISLVVAFGPQNTFLLRQGVSNTHLRVALLASIACEIFLVVLGVAGVGTAVEKISWLKIIFALAGAFFLGFFGYRSARRALTSEYNDEKSKAPFATSKAVIMAALSFSLLNPASLFDTIVLIGGFSGQFNAQERIAYAAGSLVASSFWFVSLVYGARQLAPVFKRPAAWRVFDWVVAVLMFGLSLKLLWEAFAG